MTSQHSLAHIVNTTAQFLTYTRFMAQLRHGTYAPPANLFTLALYHRKACGSKFRVCMHRLVLRRFSYQGVFLGDVIVAS